MATKLILVFLALGSAGCLGSTAYPEEEFVRADSNTFSRYFNFLSALDTKDNSYEVHLYPVFGESFEGAECSISATISVYADESEGEVDYLLVSIALVDIPKKILADQSVYFIGHSDQVMISIVYSSDNCAVPSSSKVEAAGRLIFSISRSSFANN